MHVKIGHLVGSAFLDEKGPHTIPVPFSSRLYLVILSDRELPLYFRNQPTLLLNPIRQNIFPVMIQNELTCWRWFCSSQQHRRNLYSPWQPFKCVKTTTVSPPAFSANKIAPIPSNAFLTRLSFYIIHHLYNNMSPLGPLQGQSLPSKWQPPWPGWCLLGQLPLTCSSVYV